MPQYGETNSHEDRTPDMAYPVADEHNANEHSLKLPLFQAFNPDATCRMESRLTLTVSRMRHCRITADNHRWRNRARWLNAGFEDSLNECVTVQHKLGGGKDVIGSGRGLI